MDYFSFFVTIRYEFKVCYIQHVFGPNSIENCVQFTYYMRDSYLTNIT